MKKISVPKALRVPLTIMVILLILICVITMAMHYAEQKYGAHEVKKLVSQVVKQQRQQPTAAASPSKAAAATEGISRDEILQELQRQCQGNEKAQALLQILQLLSEIRDARAAVNAEWTFHQQTNVAILEDSLDRLLTANISSPEVVFPKIETTLKDLYHAENCRRKIFPYSFAIYEGAFILVGLLWIALLVRDTSFLEANSKTVYIECFAAWGVSGMLVAAVSLFFELEHKEAPPAGLLIANCVRWYCVGAFVGFICELGGLNTVVLSSYCQTSYAPLPSASFLTTQQCTLAQNDKAQILTYGAGYMVIVLLGAGLYYLFKCRNFHLTLAKSTIEMINRVKSNVNAYVVQPLNRVKRYLYGKKQRQVVVDNDSTGPILDGQEKLTVGKFVFQTFVQAFLFAFPTFLIFRNRLHRNPFTLRDCWIEFILLMIKFSLVKLVERVFSSKHFQQKMQVFLQDCQAIVQKNLLASTQPTPSLSVPVAVATGGS